MFMLKFFWLLSFTVQAKKKLFSNVVKHMLLKNFLINRLNLLNFVYIAVSDIETALEHVKLRILGQLEL